MADDFGGGQGGGKRPARIEMTPGAGNLQEAALRAALVGPFRVAHGLKKTYTLEPDESEVIARNSSASRHCLYVAVYLPPTHPGPVPLIVGSEVTPSSSAGVPVVLEPRVGEAGVSFSAVLLPGEDLSAQSPVPATLIVSSVAF